MAASTNENCCGEENIEISKTNNLIKSIGKQSLFANKILLIALSRVEDRNGKISPIMISRYQDYLDEGIDLTKGLISEIPLTEIADINNGKKRSGSFYKYLEELFKTDTTPEEITKTLKGMFNILIKNDVTGIYATVNLIQVTLYDKKQKKLFVKFTDEPIVRQNIWELKNNYTLLPRKTMLSLQSNYSFKLYEIFKSDIDRENALRRKRHEAPLRSIKKRYSIADLKFKLGILGAETSDIAAALKEKNPAYDEIEEIMEQQKKSTMPRYIDFKNYALQKAKDELHEKTNIDFDFEPIRLGRGGKVVAVDITITNKDSISEEIEVFSEEQKLVFIQEVIDFIEEKIKTVDAKSIAEASGYDMNKISEAYKIVKSSNTPVENLVGFMIKAINSNYCNVPVKNYNSQFHQFEQNEYDFNELEKKLLKKKQVAK